MSLTRVSDPGIWCHAELDEDGLPSDLNWLLSESDTVEIDAPAGFHPLPADATASCRDRLREAVELLEADLTAASTDLPFGHLSASLLEIWDLAVELGPEVAGPLENLLCELLSHHRSGRHQIASALVEVRHRLDDASVPR
ncbi:MAG TPA: hypothetical protein VNF50_01990 [Acidimicrobiales bacterium]|nr:hypothetical protein [Acidimicrobiales bacterium]